MFYFLAKNNVVYEGILLKPSMVTPGAECKDRKSPQVVAEYTLNLLKRRVPPAVPGIMVRLHMALVWISYGIKFMISGWKIPTQFF